MTTWSITQEEFRMNLSDPRIAFFDALAARWDNEEPSSQTMTARLSQQAKLLALKPGQSDLLACLFTHSVMGYEYDYAQGKEKDYDTFAIPQRIPAKACYAAYLSFSTDLTNR